MNTEIILQSLIQSREITEKCAFAMYNVCCGAANWDFRRNEHVR